MKGGRISGRRVALLSAFLVTIAMLSPSCTSTRADRRGVETRGGSSTQTPVYEATAELVLPPPPVEASEPAGKNGNDPNAVAVTLMRGPVIRQRVADQIGSAPRVAVISTPGSIQVQAESTDPEWARAVADAYVHQYIEFRKAQDTEFLTKAIAELEPRYTENQRRVNEIDRQIASAPESERESLERQLGAERMQRLSQASADLRLLDEYRLQLARAANPNVVVHPARVVEKRRS